MSSSIRQLLRFGPFELDRAARTLRRDGGLVPLPPKAFDLLVVLLESHGAVVDKSTLMQRLWPDTFVEEGNLPVTVFALRKALGEPADQYIRTVPRRGYLLDLPAEPALALAPAPDPGLGPAGVAVEAADADGPGEPAGRGHVVPRRHAPPAAGGVPRQRRLDEEPVRLGEVRERVPAGADDVLDRVFFEQIEAMADDLAALKQDALEKVVQRSARNRLGTDIQQAEVRLARSKLMGQKRYTLGCTIGL